MRKIKIVADSSANVLALDRVAFASAPLKIITADQEFVDTADLDVNAMVNYFSQYKGKSKTSCPNPADWIDAMGDAEDVFCVAITSGLSGGRVYLAHCSNAQAAEKLKNMIRAELPDVTVTIGENRGLCSYYAEVGGLLIGYEKM